VASELVNLPEDRDTLKAMVRSLALERDREKQRAEELHRRAEESKQQTEELRVEMLRLQLELERFRKWYYGPRADRLASSGEVAQMLLAFAEEVNRKPVHPDDLPPAAEAADEPRRLRRRTGRRNLAHFENLPVTTHVHELSAEERACPCCGSQRREIGAEESWQIEYYPGRFERIQHVRKKYACPGCERNGGGARIEAAAKPEAPVDKGLAGPGLLAYIVTSKFSDYLPLYRLEDIFQRQGFEISRATQSIWCGDVAGLVEPLYELMAGRVRASRVVATGDTVMPMLAKGKTANARMWVYVGDEAAPYNIFDFTLNRGRDGPKYFLKDYGNVLLADAYGGYNGVVAGNGITCRGAPRQRPVRGRAAGTASGRLGAGADEPEGEAPHLETAVVAEASHGRGREVRAGPMGGTERVLFRRSCAHRQQHQRARDEAGRAQPQELVVCGKRARRPHSGDPGEHHQQLPPARCGPAVVPDAVAGEPARGAMERTVCVVAG